MKYFKYFIIAFSISMSTVAAYYSVTGLTKLFGGENDILLISLFVLLESSKVIMASILHSPMFKKSSIIIKTYIISAIIILSAITSVGIYGNLSYKFEKSKNKLYANEMSIKNIEYKINDISEKIKSLNNDLSSNNKRLNTLYALRINQENRLDSLYNKGWYNSAKRTELLIKESDSEIQNIKLKNDHIYELIDSLNVEKSKLLNEKMELSVSDDTIELGPILYVSKLMGKDIDNVAMVFMVVIIFLFDPLALILLVIATKKIKSDDTQEIKEDTSVDSKNEKEYLNSTKKPERKVNKKKKVTSFVNDGTKQITGVMVPPPTSNR